MFQDASPQVQSPHTLRTGNYSFTWASTHLCSLLTQLQLPCGRATLKKHFSQKPFSLLFSSCSLNFLSNPLDVFLSVLIFPTLQLTSAGLNWPAFYSASMSFVCTNTHALSNAAHKVFIWYLGASRQIAPRFM